MYQPVVVGGTMHGGLQASCSQHPQQQMFQQPIYLVEQQGNQQVMLPPGVQLVSAFPQQQSQLNQPTYVLVPANGVPGNSAPMMAPYPFLYPTSPPPQQQPSSPPPSHQQQPIGQPMQVQQQTQNHSTAEPPIQSLFQVESSNQKTQTVSPQAAQMSASRASAGSSAKIASTSSACADSICRHFLTGKCNRRKCRFLHSESGGSASLSTSNIVSKNVSVTAEKPQESPQK